VQKSFEVFADLFMNINRDVVAPAMKAAADDMYGPEADRIFTPDTRDLMGFFIMMRKLLVEVCFEAQPSRTQSPGETDS
jgi:kinetochore protein Nuf2